MSDTTKSTNGRFRNFACVVYPESAPEGWIQILADQKVPAFVSPLHDKDIDPQNQPKKPHFHVVIAFEGKKSIEQAKELFDKFNGVGCEVVQSIRGYARYLCHLDNPEKVQYDISQVKSFGGADYVTTIGLPTDKYKALGEMMAYCHEHQIVSFAVLAEIAYEQHFDWFRVLADSGSVFMKEYLKSKSWTCRRPSNLPVDDETGEIL